MEVEKLKTILYQMRTQFRDLEQYCYKMTSLFLEMEEFIMDLQAKKNEEKKKTIDWGKNLNKIADENQDL